MENKQTPVESLRANLPSLFLDDSGHYKNLFQEALEAEREQNINIIIDFQLFMAEHGYISNFLWDFEDMATKFLNNKNFMCTLSTENYENKNNNLL
jgi:hypothetical protein